MALGNTFRDPTLAVRGSIGRQLAFDDDFCGSHNPHIDFTAPYSGTYLLDVGGLNSFTGTCTLIA